MYLSHLNYYMIQKRVGSGMKAKTNNSLLEAFGLHYVGSVKCIYEIINETAFRHI